MAVVTRLVVVSTAILLATLCGCASKDGAEISPGGSSATTTSQQVFQRRSLACGTGVDAPARPSKPSDVIQLAISGTHFTDSAITVSYTITAPDRATDLTLPIGPTPVTVLLMRDGKIVGQQHPSAPDGTADGSAALAYKVGEKPWAGELTVDQLCAGTSWGQIAANRSSYLVEVLMSEQPGGGPQTAPAPAYLPDPLSVASATL